MFAKSPVTQNILKAGHELCSLSTLKWIHEIGRRIYCGPFLRFYVWILRTLSKIPDLNCEIRNSSLNRDRFDLFMSDLDLTAIIPPYLEEQKLEELILLIQKSRRVFPFIGEIEVYTQVEIDLKREIEKTHGPGLQLFLNIRRLIWQIKSFKKSSSSYHLKKSERSLTFRLNEFGVGFRDERFFLREISPVVERRVLEIFRTPLLKKTVFDHSPIFSPYLSCWITSELDHEFQGDALILNPEARLIFLACLPDTLGLTGELNQLVSDLREKPEILGLRAAVSLWELFLVRSCLRIKTLEDNSVTRGWIRELSATVKKARGEHSF